MDGGGGRVGSGRTVGTQAQARAGFDAWRVALTLAEHHEHGGDAVTYLSAKDDRNSVRVVLLADLLDDAGGHP